mmetsp:Transcript_107667/g.185646  ORF Transcript_107667/g.185646 Transcript_107667/m.185646 type:complete len:82 (+) Transcript_107667:51-296(+)
MPFDEDVRELTVVLKRLTGASSLLFPAIEDLLVRWGSSSPVAKMVLKAAAPKASPKWVQGLQQEPVNRCLCTYCAAATLAR